MLVLNHILVQVTVKVKAKVKYSTKEKWTTKMKQAQNMRIPASPSTLNTSPLHSPRNLANMPWQHQSNHLITSLPSAHHTVSQLPVLKHAAATECAS